METERFNAEEFNEVLGERLKRARLQRGLTREQLLNALQLVTDSPFFEHVINIRRVETGETGIKLQNLIILAHVLHAEIETLLEDLPGMPEKERTSSEKELRETIQQHINLLEYDKVGELVAQLKSHESMQFKYWCEGFLAHRQQENPDLARKKLLEALKVTLPAAFHKKTDSFLSDKLDKFELTWLECHIWMELANVESVEKGFSLYERLYEKVSQSKLSSFNERDKKLTMICYNVTVYLFRSGIIDERVADYCQRGISLEIETKQLSYLGHLYYNLARYYFENTDMLHAKKFFQHSYDFFRLTKNADGAEKTFSMVLKECGITLRTE